MIRTIDTTTLQNWLDAQRDFILVDTLPASAFAAGHLPGAVNLVSDDILAQAAERFPDREATLVVYCASATCKRAGLAAERLERLGYGAAYHYVGGKKDWIAAGLALE